MLNKNILVPVASGIEELEFITIVDVLRRACVEVRVCSVEEREISTAHQVKITADSQFIDEVIEDYDGIILPGGSDGAERFFEFSPLAEALEKFAKEELLIGAICASPALVLAPLGILDTKKATCYPSFKAKLKNYTNEAVVVDKNIITSQGPGTALAFAFKLVEILAGREKAKSLKFDMLYTP